jgi:protein phosphatase
MRIRSFGISDIGRCRVVNEDAYFRDDQLGFYVVADGVGGRAKGEVASAMAVEETYGYLQRDRAVLDKYVRKPDEEGLFAVRRLLESAVQSACYMVFGLSEQDPEHHGMSSTISALLTLANDLGVVAQVGDSRIYRLRGDETRQITEDHTLINYRLKKGLITPEEARDAPGKNIITRAVGHRDYVHVDTMQCSLLAGDRFLLCSDGLHSYLREDEVDGLLRGGDQAQVGQRLIDLANNRGGQDNITVLLVDVE